MKKGYVKMNNQSGCEYAKGMCVLCDHFIDQELTGEPCIESRGTLICTQCAIDLIEPIYKLGGMGGIQHLIFKELLSSNFNKKRRSVIRNYKKIFAELLMKYNFQCVFCGEKDEKKLTIDHIHPVSKGGSDEFQNLQILCKSCNSSKGAKILP